MASAPPKNRVADAWLLLGVATLVAGIVGLLRTGLLWTVPVPTLVAVVVLLIAAAPTVMYGVARRGRAWATPIVVAAVAIGAAIVVVDNFEPSGAALREVYSETPIAGWPGAGPVMSYDGCRYWCFINDGPTGTSVGSELTTDDVQGTCLQIADRLVTAGWKREAPVPNTDWCVVSVSKPAPLRRTYTLDLSISPDNRSPVVDVAHGGPEPGRVFVSLRAVR